MTGFQNDPFSKWPISEEIFFALIDFEVTHFQEWSISKWPILNSNYVDHFLSDPFRSDHYFEVIYFDITYFPNRTPFFNVTVIWAKVVRIKIIIFDLIISCWKFLNLQRFWKTVLKKYTPKRTLEALCHCLFWNLEIFNINILYHTKETVRVLHKQWTRNVIFSAFRYALERLLSLSSVENT